MSDESVYFLLHIPKTAGQTIQLHLAQHCEPGAFWHPSSSHRAEARSGLNFAEVRAVSGHHVTRRHERYFTGREIRRTVLLREPVALQLSFYNYRMMNYLSKGFGTYSFNLHLRTLPRNFMTHRLLSEWLGIPWPVLMTMSDTHKYDLLNRTLAEFWFVGGVNDCDRLIAAIAPDLGVPAVAKPRNRAVDWQREVEWQPLRVEDLSAVELAAIRARHPIDELLWQNWHAAGFDTHTVRPAVTIANGSGAFFADELVRPAFQAARFAMRDRPGLKRRAARIGGDQALKEGNWSLAAQRYSAVLSDMPRAPAVWARYAHALKQMERFAEAEDAYRHLISIEPSSAQNHRLFANLLKLQGRADEAAAAFARANMLDRATRPPNAAAAE